MTHYKSSMHCKRLEEDPLADQGRLGVIAYRQICAFYGSMSVIQKTEIGGTPLYMEPEKLDQHLGDGVHAVQPNQIG